MPLKMLLFNDTAAKWESHENACKCKDIHFFISMFATRSASCDMYILLILPVAHKDARKRAHHHPPHRTEFPFPFSGEALQKKAQTDPFCLRMLLAKALLPRAPTTTSRIIFWPANANIEKERERDDPVVMVKGRANFSYGTSEA